MNLAEKMAYYEDKLSLEAGSLTLHYVIPIDAVTIAIAIELYPEWRELEAYRLVFNDGRVVEVLATPFWDGEVDGLPIDVIAEDGDTEFNTMVPLPEFSGDVEVDRRRLVETVATAVAVYAGMTAAAKRG